MNLLLDTHAFIWFMDGDTSLPESSRRVIADVRNTCLISIASLWEIAIKHSLGTLRLASGFGQITEFLESNQIELLSIGFSHLQTLLTLENHHRDPFDRLIISQALTDGLTIVSKDKNFDKYQVALFWK